MSSHAPLHLLPLHLLRDANVTTLSRAVLKRDRLLPVGAAFAEALRGAGLASGLVRGSVYGISGVSPVALAALLLAEAGKSGAWVAWCAEVSPNPRALFDAGWCLDRVVCIDPQRLWLECINACLGEFEIIVTQIPAGVGAGDVRRMASMVSRGNGVMVVLGDTSCRYAVVDVEFQVEHCSWRVEGGRLVSQTMDVVLGGRRVIEPRSFVGVLETS